jgi:hypothetical protein
MYLETHSAAQFFQSSVAFSGISGVTEKNKWKKVDFWCADFWCADNVPIGEEGTFKKKARAAFSIPASSDGSRGTGETGRVPCELEVPQCPAIKTVSLLLSYQKKQQIFEEEKRVTRRKCFNRDRTRFTKVSV